METPGFNSDSFSLVRQGYDTDEVEAFLVSQAEAWHQALRQAEQRTAQFQLELEKTQRREAALLNELNSATKAKENTMAEIEQEAELKRAEHELTIKKRADEVEASITAQLAEAEAKAAGLIRQAEHDAAESQTELEKTRTSQLAALESEHRRTTSQYEKAEAKLIESIKDLNTMRVALVDGLQAIADGGLTNAKAIDDLLDEIGLDSDDPKSSLLDNGLDGRSVDG